MAAASWLLDCIIGTGLGLGASLLVRSGLDLTVSFSLLSLESEGRPTSGVMGEFSGGTGWNSGESWMLFSPCAARAVESVAWRSSGSEASDAD